MFLRVFDSKPSSVVVINPKLVKAECKTWNGIRSEMSIKIEAKQSWSEN